MSIPIRYHPVDIRPTDTVMFITLSKLTIDRGNLFPLLEAFYSRRRGPDTAPLPVMMMRRRLTLNFEEVLTEEAMLSIDLSVVIRQWRIITIDDHWRTMTTWLYDYIPRWLQLFYGDQAWPTFVEDTIRLPLLMPILLLTPVFYIGYSVFPRRDSVRFEGPLTCDSWPVCDITHFIDWWFADIFDSIDRFGHWYSMIHPYDDGRIVVTWRPWWRMVKPILIHSSDIWYGSIQYFVRKENIIPTVIRYLSSCWLEGIVLFQYDDTLRYSWLFDDIDQYLLMTDSS